MSSAVGNMSFVFDLPVLYALGIALYFIGRKYELERISKITIGVIITLSFILFSVLLYADILSFPVCNIFHIYGNPIVPGMKGSEFVINWPLYPLAIDEFHIITKNSFPIIIAVVLFLLYPLAIFLGYATALSISKKRNRRILIGSRSYDDVKSRGRATKDPCFSISRYPDGQHGINNMREALQAAVDELGGMKNFVQKGDRVLIKANICGGNPDISATYTSQELVSYVVDLVRESQGVPFVCDADMVWAKFWVQAKAQGWDKWAEKNNVDLVNLTETDLVYFDFGEGTLFSDNVKPNQEIVSTRVLDADVIINIPKMKTHFGTGVTLGMKNMYGTLPEEDKAFYHQKGGVEELLYWVNYAFTPTLTIIDGSEGGEAEGPLSAHPVQFNTIIASNNVVLADALAAKLMGFEHPFEDLKFLRFVKEHMGDADSLISALPKEMNYTAEQLISILDLPPNSRDGKWQLPIPEVAEETWCFMENLLGLPGMPILFSIGADFILLDAARLHYWRILQGAIMQILFSPRFWIRKKRGTAQDVSRKRINLGLFALIALISLYFYSSYLPGGNLWLYELNRSFGFILGFALALALAAFFSSLMKTRHLLTIIISSVLVAYFVESSAPWAGWWVYLKESSLLSTGWFGLPLPPYYPLIAAPIFVICIIGLAHVFAPMLSSLNGQRFRLVPYVAVMIALFLFLYLEGGLTPGYEALKDPTRNMILIYSVLAILGLYFNQKQILSANISLTMAAVILGFTMEFLGALSGYWVYPQNNLVDFIGKATIDSVSGTFDLSAYVEFVRRQAISEIPIFVSLSWALNVWAACGLAQVFGVDMGRAFVWDDSLERIDPMAVVRRGNAMAAEGEYDKAIEQYDNAIFQLTGKRNAECDVNGLNDIFQTGPGEFEDQLALGEAWHGKGTALAGIGDFTNSVLAYDKAIEQYLSIHPPYFGIQVAVAFYKKAAAKQNLAVQGIIGPLNKTKEKSEKIRSDYLHESGIEIKGAMLADEALKSYDEAMSFCLNALDSSPQGPETYINIFVDKMILLQHLGRSDECFMEYEKTLDFFDDSPYMKARILIFKGFSKIYWADVSLDLALYKDAVECFSRAIELLHQLKDNDKTWIAGARWGTGYAKSRQKYLEKPEKCDESIINEYHQSLIDLDAKGASFVWCDLADEYMDQMRYLDGLDAYEKALEEHTQLTYLQQSHLWRGNGDEIWKLAAHIWMGKGDAYFKIAESQEDISQRLQDEDRALKAYKRAIDAFDRLPREGDAQTGKALVLLKMGRILEAIMAYEKATLIGEELGSSTIAKISQMLLAKAWTGKGNAFLRMGRNDDAICAFNRARKMVKDYSPARAMEDVNKGKMIEPRWGEVWRHRGVYLSMLQLKYL